MEDELKEYLDSLSAEEIEQMVADSDLNELREQRNFRLQETDWWVMPDRTATQAQLDYRQALRDITDNYSNTLEVVWPDKP